MASKSVSDFGLALIRIGTSLMLFLLHGWGKSQSALAFLLQGKEWKFIEGVRNLGFPIPEFFAICAALAETVGSLFLAFGLFTRYAAALVGFNMLVAVYRHVTTDGEFELAALYALPAVAFIFINPGYFSIDEHRGKHRKP